MAVLIKSTVQGQTTEGYSNVLELVKEPLKNALGFIMHFAHPSANAWAIYEVWQTKAEADEWFKKFIVPGLPKGIRAKRNYVELYSIVNPMNRG